MLQFSSTKLFLPRLPLFLNIFVYNFFFHSFVHSYLQPYNLLKWLKKTCCVVLLLVLYFYPLLFVVCMVFVFVLLFCIRFRLQFSTSNFNVSGEEKEEAMLPCIPSTVCCKSLCSIAYFPADMQTMTIAPIYSTCMYVFAFMCALLMKRKLFPAMDRLHSQPNKKKPKSCFVFSIHISVFCRWILQYKHLSSRQWSTEPCTCTKWKCWATLLLPDFSSIARERHFF